MIDGSTSIWGCELAALDFETTGLFPDQGDRAIEVAVVRGRFGEVPRRWNALIDPDRAVDAVQIHGITDDMVRGAPRFADIASQLCAALDGAVLVAHNARFDVAFMRMEWQRTGGTPPVCPVVDTLGLSRRALALPSHSLTAVCAHLGIARDRAHRAPDDALATWELAWRLLVSLDPERTATVNDAERLSRRPTMEELRATADALLKAARKSQRILIDYRRGDAKAIRREITVHKVHGQRVEAFCHLRGEDRVFRIERIRVLGTH